MAQPIQAKTVLRKKEAPTQHPSFLQKIATFLTGAPSRVGTRPISAKDSFSRRPANHVYAPARLQQMAQGTQPNHRPSDLQLTQFCNKVVTG